MCNLHISHALDINVVINLLCVSDEQVQASFTDLTSGLRATVNTEPQCRSTRLSRTTASLNQSK